MEEEADRKSAQLKKRLEREARELDEKCAGKPPEEQARLRNEYCKKLEAEMRVFQRRAHEIGRQMQAKKQAKQKSDEMPSATNEPSIFHTVTGMDEKKDSSTHSKRGKRSHACGCDCDDCLEGRHEDCEDDCDIW